MGSKVKLLLEIDNILVFIGE